MKRSSRLFFTLIAFVLCISPGLHAQETKNGLLWYTDVNTVYQVSKETKKPVFAFFTGSDWCGWCHRLEHNVFEKPGFRAWAKKNVILLELDFPRNKVLPEELRQQNAGLQQFFGVQGYPTIWLFFMDKDTSTNKFNISPLGSLGYPSAAPGKEEVAFLEKAGTLLTKPSAARR